MMKRLATVLGVFSFIFIGQVLADTSTCSNENKLDPHECFWMARTFYDQGKNPDDDPEYRCKCVFDNKVKKQKTKKKIFASIAPTFSTSDKTIGLIPAIDGARLLISYQGNPNKTVLAKAISDIPGSRVFLAKYPMKRLDAKYAEDLIKGTPQFQTDSKGRLNAVVFFRLVENEAKQLGQLKAPGNIQIAFREEGKKKNEVSVFVKVGLGLNIYYDKMINVSVVLSEPPHHLWYAFVKSDFYKNFDLLAYQTRIKNTQVAKRVLVNVRSVPINFEADGSHMIDGASGKADIIPAGSDMRRSVGQYHVFSKAPKGTVLTVATLSSKQPYKEHRGLKFPAINQKQNGFYAKGFYALTALAEADEISQRTIPARQISLEPRVLDGKVYVLTLDEPQSVYASLACMLNAQTANQLVVLTLLEFLPSVGGGVGTTRTIASLLCELVSGDYTRFIKNVRDTVGKEAAKHLIKEKLIPYLTKGKISPKLYRLIGKTVTDDEKEKIAYALKNALDTGVTLGEAATYKTPAQQKELEKEIAGVIIEKNKAFEEFTRLATQGGKGNIKEAQKRWREANKKLEYLKSRRK